MEKGEAESPALRYRCERLRAEFMKPPCEKNVKRADALLKEFKNPHLGPLEHCRECRGEELERIEAKEEKVAVQISEAEAATILTPEQIAAVVPVREVCPPAVKGLIKGQFCKNHPDREAHKDKNGRYLGRCLECMGEQAARNRWGKGKKLKGIPPGPHLEKGGEVEGGHMGTPLQEGRRCKAHPERAAVIDKLGRSMAFCKECIVERGRRNGRLSQSSGGTGPPVSIPLNQAKYAELREWLLAQADENERTLQMEVMYRLKLAMRMAGEGAVISNQ